MPTDAKLVRERFLAAAEFPAAQRTAYLAANCGDDAELRAAVERLLAAHEQPASVLNRPVPGGLGQTQAFIPREQPGAVIGGRYKLLEEIGEGGMGTVWVAEQTEPVRRKVALKLIKAGMDSKSVLARFEAERQALAVMDHPNIAKVLDGGLTDTGRPYFVMEYVKGVPITEYCDATRLSVPERLNLFVQVCQAVQHAHQKGIIHRDLKPSNILVAPYDDKPVPKVIDFGLAKAMHQSLTERTLHTAHETVLGTPLYMSPEQAQLNNLDVDTRSDIYSLGVLLYELLTGTTPLEKHRYKKAAWDEVKRIIREEEPPRPSARLSSSTTLPSLAAGRQTEPARLTKLVRGELDWIVMKSLEKDRTRRYETANGFAMDVQRYLADEQVQACPPSVGYRLQKFARRNRRALAAVTAFGGLLVCATAVSIGLAAWALRAETATHQALEQVTGEQQKTQAALEQVTGEQQKTQAALGRETTARNDALERLRESYYVQAQANRWSGRPGRRFDSLVALTKAAAIPSNSGRSILELRNEAIASLALADVSSNPLWVTSLPNSNAIAMHPDFQHYATWSREEGELYVRRCSDHAEVARFPALKDSIWPVVFSPDGRYLAVCSRRDAYADPAEGKRSRLDVWDWKERTSVLTVTDAPSDVTGVAFSPDNSRLLVSWRPGKVVTYDLRGNDPPATFAATGVVVFHPDGAKVAVRDGKTVAICDAVTGRAVSKPLVVPGTAFAVNWSPDGQLLAIGCANMRGYLYDAGTGVLRAQLVGHQAEVNRVFFSPDGSLLVSTDWNGITRLWDGRNGRHLVTVKGGAFGFSRDGTQLSYMNGTEAGVWQVASGREYRELWGHTCFKGPGGVRWVLGDRLVASSGDDATRLWDPATGKQIGLLPVSGNSLRFHPHGRSWYTGGESGFYRWPVEELGTGGQLRIGPPEKFYEASATNVSGVDLSADGQWLVVWDRARGQVIVRSTTNPTQQQTFAGFVELAGAAISPDNHWLVVGGWPHHFLHVYDLSTEQCVHKHSLITSATFCFSPDGKWLAVGNAEGGSLVKVGSWTTRREIPPRKGNPRVWQLAYSRDGSILAVSRSEPVIQLLDVATLTELAALESPTPAPGARFEFSPDGSRMAVACGTRVVHLWDLRAIRGGLAQLGLDWNAPPYAAAATPLPPPTVEVSATGLVDPQQSAALQRGLELNNQAWKLLNGPPDQRDAAKALALIQEAVKLRLNDATLLNTLGVAQYRNALYRDAVATFEKNLDASKGQWDGFDLFFLAMSHARLDDKEKARECFDRGTRWVEQRKNLSSEHDAELKQFRAEAEPLLRESMGNREKQEPDDWSTFNTKSLLGGALLGQKKYAEAEPLLLAGYEGMEEREAKIPEPAKVRLPEALDRLIDLYTATNKPDEVTKWQVERAKYPQPPAPPLEKK